MVATFEGWQFAEKFEIKVKCFGRVFHTCDFSLCAKCDYHKICFRFNRHLQVFVLAETFISVSSSLQDKSQGGHDAGSVINVCMTFKIPQSYSSMCITKQEEGKVLCCVGINVMSSGSGEQPLCCAVRSGQSCRWQDVSRRRVFM